MPVKSINIAIACDHVIFGKALKMYFKGLKDFNVLVTSTDYDNLVTNCSLQKQCTYGMLKYLMNN